MMWGLMVLCPKNWIIFTNLGQGLSQKVCFFLIFEQNVGFFKQEIYLRPCLWLFRCCIFTNLFKYYLKGRFSLKRHLKLP